ncbi:hypothetical protein SCHPADRAFT_348324 [Schizopora paradoxa]|uniref:DUF6534 domain-containing protein n=1 Tax=Schizopora paradoxa TaxID=27342 RepID=A0A0H2RP90_9AGAM|nr:hypothetical protein SCHPADRAFT_348324 [Schizopora paradoxa]
MDSKWVVFSTKGTNIAADICIAGTTAYYLCKSSTGFKRSAKVLDALILFVIGSGAVLM